MSKPNDGALTYAALTHAAPTHTTLPCVRSEDILGKDREIMIEHAGALYRLSITRANKLILTK